MTVTCPNCEEGTVEYKPDHAQCNKCDHVFKYCNSAEYCGVCMVHGTIDNGKCTKCNGTDIRVQIWQR